jgi:glutamate-1-semialdehyde 2,1-aminomutase
MGIQQPSFEAAHRTSQKLFEQAMDCLAGGVTHESRYVAPFPIYVQRAHGSRKWDVDGNEYIDYSMGSASLLLGHAYPSLVEAIQDQAAKGTFYGNCHPLEVEWAALVQSLIPSAGRSRFVASGTEATMLAIRVARAYTGRTKILRFEGHYHGWHDYAVMGMQEPFSEAPCLGLLPGSVEATVVVPANDPTRVEEILRKDPDIAAVILEASGGSWGTVPLVPGFLAELRHLTSRYGALLIFDEIITGFRHSPGGCRR